MLNVLKRLMHAFKPLCVCKTMIEQVHDHVASTMPTRYISVSEGDPRAQSLILSVKISKRNRESVYFYDSEK